VQQVVAGRLPLDLGQDRRALLDERLLVLAALEVLADLEVVGGDAVLEEAGVQEVPQRLAQVERGSSAGPRRPA
jgi:cell division protein ZapA (FtsZ GTPase activity inhibitor)